MSVKSGSSAWLLDDGRAGHWRQVRALARHLPLEPVAVPVRLRAPWRWLAPYQLPFGLAAHPGLLAAGGSRPRIIISCGRRSALAARWLQQHLGGRPKTVQILDCGLPPDRFDRVITPRHDRVEGANVIATIGSLNPVDDEWLAGFAGHSNGGTAPIKPVRLLLLGGPSKNFAFSRPWLRSGLAGLGDHFCGGGLVVVESPRTPAWAADEVRRLAPGLNVQRLAWNPGDPERSERDYAAMLAQADAVFVTADSVNLASEACATGRPVCLLGLERARGKIAQFGRLLVDEGYAQMFNPEPGEGLAVRPTRRLLETESVAKRLIESGLLDPR